MTPEEWFAQQTDLITCPMGNAKMRLEKCLQRQRHYYKRISSGQKDEDDLGYVGMFQGCAIRNCEHFIPTHGTRKTIKDSQRQLKGQPAMAVTKKEMETIKRESRERLAKAAKGRRRNARAYPFRETKTNGL